MGANNTTNNESKFSDISSLINESIVEQSSKNSFNYNSYITQDISQKAAGNIEIDTVNILYKADKKLEQEVNLSLDSDINQTIKKIMKNNIKVSMMGDQGTGSFSETNNKTNTSISNIIASNTNIKSITSNKTNIALNISQLLNLTANSGDIIIKGKLDVQMLTAQEIKDINNVINKAIKKSNFIVEKTIKLESKSEGSSGNVIASVFNLLFI